MKNQHYFAPGVIEAAPEPQRNWVWIDLAGALALMVLAFFLAGWLL